jgi:hypothetical protein
LSLREHDGGGRTYLTQRFMGEARSIKFGYLIIPLAMGRGIRKLIGWSVYVYPVDETH